MEMLWGPYISYLKFLRQDPGSHWFRGSFMWPCVSNTLTPKASPTSWERFHCSQRPLPDVPYLLGRSLFLSTHHHDMWNHVKVLSELACQRTLLFLVSENWSNKEMLIPLHSGEQCWDTNGTDFFHKWKADMGVGGDEWKVNLHVFPDTGTCLRQKGNLPWPPLSPWACVALTCHSSRHCGSDGRLIFSSLRKYHNDFHKY